MRYRSGLDIVLFNDSRPHDHHYSKRAQKKSSHIRFEKCFCQMVRINLPGSLIKMTSIFIYIYILYSRRRCFSRELLTLIYKTNITSHIMGYMYNYEMSSKIPLL